MHSHEIRRTILDPLARATALGALWLDLYGRTDELRFDVEDPEVWTPLPANGGIEEWLEENEPALDVCVGLTRLAFGLCNRTTLAGGPILDTGSDEPSAPFSSLSVAIGGGATPVVELEARPIEFVSTKVSTTSGQELLVVVRPYRTREGGVELQAAIFNRAGVFLAGFEGYAPGEGARAVEETVENVSTWGLVAAPTDSELVQ